ncbi:S1 family peptidase [Zavarzinella formosa]|uniref:S1 family peptidase n=1 Tax=Zavarzinella formosa TaxID=360055 RepID=UPI000316CF9F|nr:serine protease [Zavarzinella formosa]
MAIHYACPVCKTSHVVDDWEAGKKSNCQKCGQRLQVPAASPPQMRTILGETVSSEPRPKPAPRPPRQTPPPPTPASRPDPVPMPSYLAVNKNTRLRAGPIMVVAVTLFGLIGIGVAVVSWMVRKGPAPAVATTATKPEPASAPKTTSAPVIPQEENTKTPAAEPDDPPPVVVLTQPLTGEQVYERLVRSSVFIITPTGAGTGFIVSKGKRLLVTNFHVVGRETEVLVLYPLYDKAGELITDASFYRKQGRGIAVPGTVVEKDVTRDLAMIEVEKIQEKATAVSLAIRPAATGSTLFSVGGSGIEENLLWRLTKGTVRGRVQRRQKAEFGTVDCMILETDAPLNHGDSGGPVMNDRGELVAVVSHGLANQRQVSGNIDVEEVRKFVTKFTAKR